MDSQITIPGHYIYLLEDRANRDEFIDGLVSISKCVEPGTASRVFIAEAWADISKGLVQPKILKGLPAYADNGKLTPAWTERYRSVSKGWLPFNMQDGCSVKGLKFTNITTATGPELARLEKIINGHFKTNPKTRQLEHWLRYILEVMSFCVRNELLDLK